MRLTLGAARACMAGPVKMPYMVSIGLPSLHAQFDETFNSMTVEPANKPEKGDRLSFIVTIQWSIAVMKIIECGHKDRGDGRRLNAAQGCRAAKAAEVV